MKIIATTIPNQALGEPATQQLSDLATIASGAGSFMEQLIEYAGRVCYRSTARMGTSGNFIADRVRADHSDILEHARVIVATHSNLKPWWEKQPYTKTTTSGLADGSTWISSANLRTWLHIWQAANHDKDLDPIVYLAPQVFSKDLAERRNAPHQRPISATPQQNPPQLVTLLGATMCHHKALDEQHASATFLIEGISRACSHQIVRHRLGSFSQESQRYVDLAKGEWLPIVPPELQGNPEIMRLLENHWSLTEATYQRLRNLGVRKEDARMLLPNATSTRLVMSMTFDGWRNFLYQRQHSAAQWEIRAVANAIAHNLREIAPNNFP